jgi:hypothetical protein
MSFFCPFSIRIFCNKMTTRLLQSIKNVSMMTVRTLAAQKGGNLSGAKLGGSFGSKFIGF